MLHGGGTYCGSAQSALVNLGSFTKTPYDNEIQILANNANINHSFPGFGSSSTPVVKTNYLTHLYDADGNAICRIAPDKPLRFYSCSFFKVIGATVTIPMLAVINNKITFGYLPKKSLDDGSLLFGDVSVCKNAKNQESYNKAVEIAYANYKAGAKSLQGSVIESLSSAQSALVNLGADTPPAKPATGLTDHQFSFWTFVGASVAALVVGAGVGYVLHHAKNPAK